MSKSKILIVAILGFLGVLVIMALFRWIENKFSNESKKAEQFVSKYDTPLYQIISVIIVFGIGYGIWYFLKV